MVSGHVDGVAEVVARRDFDGMAHFKLPRAGRARQVHRRQGLGRARRVSLTVNAVAGDAFEVLLIPHTLAVTTLGGWTVGGKVNIEVDQMARYAARLIEAGVRARQGSAPTPSRIARRRSGPIVASPARPRPRNSRSTGARSDRERAARRLRPLTAAARSKMSGAARARRNASASPPRRCRQRRRRLSSSPSMSRKPRLRPCAPIGGKACAASPTSASRVATSRADALARHRKQSARALDAHGAEHASAPDARSRGQRRIVERGAPRRLASRTSPRPGWSDGARPARRQGDEGERALAGVELGRDVVVGARVARGRPSARSADSAEPRLDPGGAARRRKLGRRRRRSARAAKARPSSSRSVARSAAKSNARDPGRNAAEIVPARRRRCERPRRASRSRCSSRKRRDRSRARGIRPGAARTASRCRRR